MVPLTAVQVDWLFAAPLVFSWVPAIFCHDNRDPINATFAPARAPKRIRSKKIYCIVKMDLLLILFVFQVFWAIFIIFRMRDRCCKRTVLYYMENIPTGCVHRFPGVSAALYPIVRLWLADTTKCRINGYLPVKQTAIGYYSPAVSFAACTVNKTWPLSAIYPKLSQQGREKYMM